MVTNGQSEVGSCTSRCFESNIPSAKYVSAKHVSMRKDRVGMLPRHRRRAETLPEVCGVHIHVAFIVLVLLGLMSHPEASNAPSQKPGKMSAQPASL